MNLGRLETELESIIDDTDIPGVSFFEALCEIARTGQWEKWGAIFGADVTRLLRESYESNPSEFISKNETIALECKRRFVSNSVSKLTSLSRMTFTPGARLADAEHLQRLLDSSGDMLRLAFAKHLIDLVESAARRAEELKELVVDEASSPEADEYLSEACFSYYFGLHTACVVLCRSLVEEALERKLPPDLLEGWRKQAGSDNLTLGRLLRNIANHPTPLVSVQVERRARKVNDAGRSGAHTAPAVEKEAAKCLENARGVLLHLLGSVRAVKG